MDRDPELDITVSNGRRILHFQITALDPDLGIWTVAEPLGRRRVILGTAEALTVRQRLDARIAARLNAGWVPVDPGPTATEAVAWPADLARTWATCLTPSCRGPAPSGRSIPRASSGRPASSSAAKCSALASRRASPDARARSGNGASASWLKTPGIAWTRSGTIARRSPCIRASASGVDSRRWSRTRHGDPLELVVGESSERSARPVTRRLAGVAPVGVRARPASGWTMRSLMSRVALWIDPARVIRDVGCVTPRPSRPVSGRNHPLSTDSSGDRLERTAFVTVKKHHRPSKPVIA
jgi:hypothetical protein